MGKRKHVPTDLHSELSEYSSLIRALRTSNTLDLSTQLTLVDGPGTQPTSQPNDETYEDDEDENLETADAGEDDADVDVDNGEPALVEEEDAEDDVSVDHESNSRRKAKGKARAPATVRDTWTKWPLVPSEVHVPEWPFDEEVRLLAQGALRRLHPAVKTSEDNEESTQVEEADGDEDTEEDEASDSDDELPAETVHSLARATAKRLYEILGAASVMLPKGEDSMQNRHGYINWELVLSAVDAFGLYTPEQLESFKERMLVLYPKYKTDQRQDPFIGDSNPPPPEDKSYLELEWYPYFDPKGVQLEGSSNSALSKPSSSKKKKDKNAPARKVIRRRKPVDDEGEWGG